MSGNSGWSRAQTAPIVCRRCCSGCGALWAWSCSSSQEGEPVLADLDLVVVFELGRLDPLLVDEGAVEAAEIADRERLPVPQHLGVLARDGDVVEVQIGKYRLTFLRR